MLKRVSRWDPLVTADLHVTDGADFEPDISNQAEPVNQGERRSKGAAHATNLF